MIPQRLFNSRGCHLLTREMLKTRSRERDGGRKRGNGGRREGKSAEDACFLTEPHGSQRRAQSRERSLQRFVRHAASCSLWSPRSPPTRLPCFHSALNTHHSRSSPGLASERELVPLRGTNLTRSFRPLPHRPGKTRFCRSAYKTCHDELALGLALQRGCAAPFQSRIWPSTLIAPGSRNTELIFLRRELFSPPSPSSVKQAELSSPGVSCSCVTRAEECDRNKQQ